VELPEGVVFAESSLTVDGSIYPYIKEGNKITVNTNKSKGIIRFYVVPVKSGEYNVNAYLRFDKDGGRVLQPIGTASFEGLSVTINLPEKTGTKEVIANGTIAPRSTIELYDNDEKVGEAISNANGNWEIKFELVKPYSYSLHKIYGIISSNRVDEDIKTDTYDLDYDSYYIDVSKVTMINTGQNGQNVTVFDFINGGKTPSYRVWTDMYPTFTFKVEFLKAQNVIADDVYVITINSSGRKTYIPVSYDSEKDVWIGKHNFNNFNDVPVKISVKFNTVFQNTEAKIDADMLADIYDAIAEEEAKIENEPDVEVEIDNEAIENMGFYETMGSIESSLKLCDDTTAQFKDKHQNITSSLNAAFEQTDEGVNVIFDDYQGIININNCEGLTEQKLLDDGYEKIAVTDGSYIYYKNEAEFVSTVDFSKNACMTVDIKEIAELMGINDELMLLSTDNSIAMLQNATDILVKLANELYGKCKAVYDVLEATYGNIEELTESIKELEKEMKILNKKLDSALDDLRIMKEANIPPLELENAHNRYTQAVNRYNIMQNLHAEYTRNLSALKILKGILKPLLKHGPILEYISLGLDAVKYTPQIISLHNQLDSKGCPSTSANANMIRAEINQITTNTLWYLGLMFASGKAFTAAFAAAVGFAAPTGGTSVAVGIGAAIATLVATVVIDNEFTKVYHNDYNNIVKSINNLKCDDTPNPDDGSGNGSGSGNSGTDVESGFGTIGNQTSLLEMSSTPIGYVRPSIDPSGYVYEAVPSNRVEGVKAECYYYDYALDDFGVPEEEKSDIFWNAEDYDQVNPLYTDANGMYQWDVPMGEWLVKFSKEGYYDTDSKNDPAANSNGYLPVPPPQTEVNTAIVSKSAPTVENVNVYNNEVQIIFSQYMQLDSVNAENVKVICGGNEISGTITPSNAEYNYENTVQYASIFTFIPDSELKDSATVEIERVKNYNSKEIETKFTQSKAVAVKPESISATEKIDVKYNSGALLELAVLPKEAGTNKTLTVTSSSPSVVGVVNSTVTTDENGKANIMLEGKLPGEGEITVLLDGTDIETKIRAYVGVVEDATNVCAKVTSDVESGTVVKKGRKITLSTATEGAEIYYTLDGTCPCLVDNPARVKYTEPIEINEYTFIIAYAVKEGFDESNTAGFVYNIQADQPIQKVQTPVANPNGGIVAFGKQVTLTTATEGATIYYTLDGSVPTVSSLKYKNPLIIKSKTTVKAIAAKEGMTDSDILTVEYATEVHGGGSVGGGTGGGTTGGISQSATVISAESKNEQWKFTDVAKTDWYYYPVKMVYERGITNGVAETLFAPEENVTRAQFITMLCRAYGIKEMKGDNFADAGNTWYTGYLAAAKQLGISNGTGDNMFEPELAITREEMVTLIYNYLKSADKTGEVVLKTDYADDRLISDWARIAVAYSSSVGYIKGKENNLFDPKGNATRAELAQIFFNILT